MPINTWAKDLNPKYSVMSDEQVTVYLSAAILELEALTNPTPEDLKTQIEKQFFIQIIDRRIESLKLPIKFTDAAKMVILSLVDRAGAAVVLLIDCLNAFEGKEVTAYELSELYPDGFYDEDTLIRYIDNYLKPRPAKMKWAEIY